MGRLKWLCLDKVRVVKVGGRSGRGSVNVHSKDKWVRKEVASEVSNFLVLVMIKRVREGGSVEHCIGVILPMHRYVREGGKGD